MLKQSLPRAARLSAVICVLLVGQPARAADYATAPTDVQAAMIVKLMAFDKSLSGDVTIYVIDNEDVAAALKKAVGRPIGGGTLKAVKEGEAMPASKPSAVYVSDKAKVKETVTYTRANDVLSVTGTPELVEGGVSLGIAVQDKKPKVLLNLQAAREEGVKWDPAILKVATVVKGSE